METFITYPTTRNRKRLTILTINDSKTKAAGNNHFEHEVKSRASRQSHRLSRAARRRTTNVNSRKYQVNFANTTRNEYCKQLDFTVWPLETLIVIATTLFDHKISKNKHFKLVANIDLLYLDCALLLQSRISNVVNMIRQPVISIPGKSIKQHRKMMEYLFLHQTLELFNVCLATN